MRYFLVILVLALFFGVTAVAFLAISGGSSEHALETGAKAAIVSLAVVLWVNAFFLIHELGHLIAGLRNGMEFRCITVGPVQLSRAADGRLHWTLLNNPLLGGMVIMTPPDDNQVLRRYARFIAGGPVASIVLVLAMSAVPYLMGGSLAFGDVPSGFLLWWRYALILAILLLSGTLLPFTTKTGYATDMLQLLRMNRKGEKNKAFVALLMLGREIYGGIRAREWTTSLIEVARSPAADKDTRIRAALLGYYHAYDQGHIEEARSLIQEGVSLVEDLKRQDLLRNVTFFEAAIFASLFDNDGRRAKQCLDQTWEEHESIAGTRHSALAAGAFASGKFGDCLKEIEVAERMLRDFAKRSTGSVAFELERLESLKLACETAISEPPQTA